MARNTSIHSPDHVVVAGVATTRVQVNSEGNPICGAVNRKGKPCQLAAGYSTDHPGYGTCKFHAGSMPPGRVTAARQEAAEYADNMKRLGVVGPEVSPDEALMQEVARSQAAVEFFDGEVERLTNEGTDPSSSQFTKVVWHWNEQRRLLANVSRLVVQAGIARRHIEIQEMQAVAVLGAVMAVIGSPELALSPERVDLAKRNIAGKLRELSMAQDQREAMEAVAVEIA